MWYGPPGRVPTPLKTSAYSCNIYSLVVGKGWVLPFTVIELLHHEMCADLGPCAVPDFTLIAALSSSWAVWMVVGVVLTVHRLCSLCRL